MEEATTAYGESVSTHPDVRVARLAARQHGLVTHRQLACVGLGHNAIARRVAAGHLHRVHRGVYAVGNPRLTQRGLWIAAVMRSGPSAFLSHLDGAALWGFYDGAGARIHVTVKWQRKIPGLVLHRTRRLDADEVTVRDGIPVTTVARTFVDLTELLNEDRLLRAMREAEFRGLLDLDALNAAVERAHGRRRIAALRRAAAAHRPGQIVRSELEHRFLELVRGAGLAEPAMNAPVSARGRSYVIDCLWPELGIAVELDGREAHERALAFESDRRKDAALNAIGLGPIRFTWYRVNYEPDEVLADLTAAMNRSSLS